MPRDARGEHRRDECRPPTGGQSDVWWLRLTLRLIHRLTRIGADAGQSTQVTARRSRNRRVRRSCLRKMRLFQDNTSGGRQERRAAVYREAPEPDCRCAVRFRPAGLARHSTRAAIGTTSAAWDGSQPSKSRGMLVGKPALCSAPATVFTLPPRAVPISATIVGCCLIKE